ncbi:MAG TPA: EAL domain-containing protein [Acidimicrobiales bacterium]|nr:EAL domain-containing protein [Acidimicrobiales bacterium]
MPKVELPTVVADDSVDKLAVDAVGRTVTLGGRRINMTPKEFDLLAFLVARPGVAFTRSELLQQVWASSPDWQGAATVTEHVHRLRAKMSQGSDAAGRLVTVKGAGYRFDPADPPGPPSSDDGELRRAMRDGEFTVHYQPVVELAESVVVGVEALVRWQHPTRGLLLPSAFIAGAERSGAIIELGEYVLQAACHQAEAWRDAGYDLQVSVNLSARQLTDTRLPERIATVMAATGMPADRLWLEVTETDLVQDVVLAGSVLRAIDDLGARISIDDFGTGWASLTYLHQFPVRQIKIDGSFVQGMGETWSAPVIVRSIISLGRDLGVGVVAEGVETDEQRRRLVHLGCRFGQGTFLGAPCSVETLDRVLDQRARHCEMA